MTTRLGCTECGSELDGQFAPCDFCAVDARDVDLLRVFLASRGNIREVEKHLGVSYPTARLPHDRARPARAQRRGARAEHGLTREQVLSEVAAGALDPAEAAAARRPLLHDGRFLRFS